MITISSTVKPEMKIGHSRQVALQKMGKINIKSKQFLKD